MKIDNSTIQMNSTRSYKSSAVDNNTTITRYYGNNHTNTGISTTSVKTSTVEIEGSSAVFSSSCGNGIERTDKNDITHNYTESKDVTGKNNNGSNGLMTQQLASQLAGMNSYMKEFDYNAEEDPEIAMLKRMLEMLNRNRSGKKTTPAYQNEIAFKGIKGFSAEQSASFSFGTTNIMAAQFNRIELKSSESGAQNGRWTRQTVSSGFIAGSEHTAYRSVGTVVTSDGRQIDFNITLEMSRSFAAAYESIGAETVMTDPLVINLDTDSAEISDVSFYFDLDSDGIAEKMSSLGEKSGFLAFDKNGDGVINNGSELFGTKSGDGFADLAQYDEDKNGWIDESDSIFKSLSVWVKAGQGGARLLSLSEAGVGAIFLGSQKTQAVLADENGFEGAQAAKTGVFLRENGTAGTIQHIDFKI